MVALIKADSYELVEGDAEFYVSNSLFHDLKSSNIRNTLLAAVGKSSCLVGNLGICANGIYSSGKDVEVKEDCKLLDKSDEGLYYYDSTNL